FRTRVSDFTTRSRARITDLFAGLDLVDPGVVHPPEWRPEAGDDRGPSLTSTFAGVGRKTR
ncbi:SAM-dependent methyltransferase, partial [Actinosynnema sp. NPDC023658]|uniref:SAM-dependent methyltransferase n=1 Tax=Actinosynnema sp. NPDC023658 TaxID=3155465 RepID=UPI0033F6C28C